MAAEPSSAAIESLAAVIGQSPGEASRWLQAFDCDPEKALNAYFDNDGVLEDSGSKTGWNEGHFHADKTRGGTSQPSFTVHHSDTLNPQMFSNNAPSRPPSRASASGVSKIPDLQIGKRHAMTLDEQEKVDLDKAMAMSQSMNDSQLLVGQENGVIEPSKSQFGPATREYYDTAKWTMTLPGTRVREVSEITDAPDRKREPHTPAFLKASLTETRLPALITILHAIPLAREALLNLDHTLPDYGVDPEWWDGVPIDVSGLQKACLGQAEHQAGTRELVYEMQRIMAFLDNTERAYGSGDGLVHSLKATSNWEADQSLGAILETWSAAAAPDHDSDNPLTDAFKSEARRVDPSLVPEIHSFSCLELSIPESSEPGCVPCRTLYDVLDFALWGSLQDDGSDFAFLHKLGSILCVQVTSQNRSQSSGLGIKIPATWYLDRYLESSQQRVLDMLTAQRLPRTEIAHLDQTKVRITEYKDPVSDQVYNVPVLIEQALKYFAKTCTSADMAEESLQGSRVNTAQKVSDDLRTLANNIDQKLIDLEAARAKALHQFANISQWYTKASGDPQNPPFHKYTLRGVSSAKDTTYLLERIDVHEESIVESEAVGEWQWWKLSYSHGQKHAVSTVAYQISLQKKVREIEVLKAARDESSSALLVYADEAAVSSQPVALPSQLENFVRADNLNFTAELEQFQTMKPTAPTKRKVNVLDDSDLTGEHCHSSGDEKNSMDTIIGDETSI